MDKNKFKELCALGIAHNEWKSLSLPSGAEYHKPLKLALEILYHQNADAVFSHAESPIEQIFLNSLALAFIRNSLPLVMVANVPDVLSYANDLRTTIPQIRSLASSYKQQGYEGDKLIAYLNTEVERGVMDRIQYKHLMRSLMSYEWLNLGDAYHLALQAGFPHVPVNGKGIRTDLFFWKPERDNFELVVECDGYKYHSNVEAFTRDKKRDRALQLAGLKVQRFSGTEIWNDPIGVANELFAYLFQNYYGTIESMANDFEHRGISYCVTIAENYNSVVGGGYADSSVTVIVNGRHHGSLDFRCPASFDALDKAKKDTEAWIDLRLDTGQQIP